MERVQLGSHSESEGPPPKLPPQPRPPSSSALKAKAAGLSIPIARYSAGQAALAWHESRSDKQSLTSLPSSTLALPNLQQTRGRVTKNATSGYVQVFEYNLPATRYPPHPEGALHIVDLTEYCKKEQCPADVAHARWVKDLAHGERSQETSTRTGLRYIKSIRNIYVPKPGQVGVEGKVAFGVCGGLKVCEFTTDDFIAKLKAEEDSGSGPTLIGEREESIRNEEAVLITKTISEYLSLLANKCPAMESEGKRCPGKPKLFSETLNGVEKIFVGCDLADHSDLPEKHRRLDEPDGIDFDLLQRLVSGERLTPEEVEQSGLTGRSCHTVANSSSHLVHCTHPHIRDGRPVLGRMRQFYCETVHRRFVSPESNPYRFAILRTGICRHPFANSNLGVAGRLNVLAASEQIREAGGKPTTTGVRQVFDGGEGSISAIGYAGIVDQNVRNVLTLDSRRRPQEGNGWEGLCHMVRRDQEQPIEERYAHCATIVPSIRSETGDQSQLHYAILFTKSMIDSIHRDGAHLQMIATFPFGSNKADGLKEFKIGARVGGQVFARILLNVQTKEAYSEIFPKFFDLVEKVTGKPIRFGFMYDQFPRETYPVFTITADMEAAPILALGEYLTEVLGTLDPQTVRQSLVQQYPILWPPPSLAVIKSFLIIPAVHWKRSILPLFQSMQEEIDGDSAKELAPLAAYAKQYAGDPSSSNMPSDETFLAIEAELRALPLPLQSDLELIWRYHELADENVLSEFWNYFAQHNVAAIRKC
ncbi:hypothetical protein JCM5350_004731 [Sporobolomyces pararoseus]